MSKGSNNVTCYTIQDIADWQLDLKHQLSSSQLKPPISLPSLQRGFVWKPHQIESLWDSLLRGYPIGAVLVSKSENAKELLDGQQRSTSIALGYSNPLDTGSTPEIFNLKKNIPSIWIDLQPLRKSTHNLKYGLRVLTRSHPWGYQLTDHRSTLTTSDREEALKFFRERAQNEEISFADFKTNQISPWDCHFPVPLFALLTCSSADYKSWKKELMEYIESNLYAVKTKHTAGLYVDYSKAEDAHLQHLWEGVRRAKNILVPEIHIDKEVFTTDDDIVESAKATLFVRLNSEGTRISGEELIYSLLKAAFPEAKQLVEDIGLKYIAPSRVVNLFARLTLIELSAYENYNKQISVVEFRRALTNDEFKTRFKQYVGIGKDSDSPAKRLMQTAIGILSTNQETKESLPQVFVKDIVAGNPDLFLVMLAHLAQNSNLTPNKKQDIHKGFHAVALFNTEKRGAARIIFKELQKIGFSSWKRAIEEARKDKFDIVLPLITPSQFRGFLLTNLVPYLLEKRDRHFSSEDNLKEVINTDADNLGFLFFNTAEKGSVKDSDRYQNMLTDAASFWDNLSSKVYWDKHFLVLAQTDYFKREFKEFMEFDGIEDTNRPWDWDHIYPNSWVYRKQEIARLARWSVNTNGNYRALSFNENRSQSNHQSPYTRFQEEKAQRDSFINDDLEHWLALTNDDKRLIEDRNKPNLKVDAFVHAVFTRISNMYEVAYDLFGYKAIIKENV